MSSEDKPRGTKLEQRPEGMEAVPEAVTEVRALLRDQDLEMRDLLQATEGGAFEPMTSGSYCIAVGCYVICCYGEQK